MISSISLPNIIKRLFWKFQKSILQLQMRQNVDPKFSFGIQGGDFNEPQRSPDGQTEARAAVLGT